MKGVTIKKASAMQLACRLTRLQFDEEAGASLPGDVKEMLLIKKEFKRRLIKILGRDFYPPEKSFNEGKKESHKRTKQGEVND